MQILYSINIREPGSPVTRSVPITARVIRIGASPVCELPIRVAHAAPIECLVRFDAHSWLVCPCAEPGSTLIDGQPLQRPTPVRSGVQFQIAGCELSLVPALAAPQIPARSFGNPEPQRRTPSIPHHHERIDPSFGRFRAPSHRSVEPLPPLTPPNPITPSPLDPTSRLFTNSPSPSIDRHVPPQRQAHANRAPAQRTDHEPPAAPRWRRPVDPPAASPPRAGTAKPPIQRASSPAPLTQPAPPLEGRSDPPRARPARLTRAPSDIAPGPTHALSDSNDLSNHPSAWLDPEELAGRTAWEASDRAESEGPNTPEPQDVPTPLSAPQAVEQHSRLLINYEFDLPHELDSREPIDPTPQPPCPPQATVETAPPPRAEILEDPEPQETTTTSLSREPVWIDNPSTEWPSARAILAAHAGSPPQDQPTKPARSAPAPAKPVRARSRPEPTRGSHPAAWFLVGRLPFLLFAMFAALVGLAFTAWTWLCVLDDQAAEVEQKRLLAGKLGARPARGEPPVENPWWATSSHALYLQAAALTDRGRPTDEAQARLDAASALSPLDPATHHARFLLASPSVREDRGPYQPAHDIECLAAAALDRLALDQPERARDALRDGFDLVTAASLDHAQLPRRNLVQPQSRSPLPNEDLYSPLLGVLLEKSMTSADQLRQVVPDYAPAWLAIARRWQDERIPHASAVLAYLAQLPEEPPDGGSSIMQRVAIAEGCALSGSYDRAIEIYESVLDHHAPFHNWAGLLWLNLGKLHERQHHREQAELARHAAQRALRRGGPAARAIQTLLDEETPAYSNTPKG